jgi:hypothetical protein
MKKSVSDNSIRTGIEKTKIGRVIRYTEIPWKYDSENKRVLMNIEWNELHVQFCELKKRLDDGDNIKIVIGTSIWYIYKNGRATNDSVWERGRCPGVSMVKF